MFVPKPKVKIKEIQKQDLFYKNGERLDLNDRFYTHGHFYTKVYAVTIRELVERGYLVRRRIYIAFELRDSFRLDGVNKSKSRALGAVTIREGDAVPKSFLKKVREKLDSFGLSQTDQRAMMKQVKSHLENAMSVVGSEHVLETITR